MLWSCSGTMAICQTPKGDFLLRDSLHIGLISQSSLGQWATNLGVKWKVGSACLNRLKWKSFCARTRCPTGKETLMFEKGGKAPSWSRQKIENSGVPFLDVSNSRNTVETDHICRSQIMSIMNQRAELPSKLMRNLSESIYPNRNIQSPPHYNHCSQIQS